MEIEIPDSPADHKAVLDAAGWRILTALQDDARLSFNQLARRVGLSAPAVAERVRRMEDLGLIRGYAATLDRTRLGRPLLAFMRLTASGDDYPRVTGLATKLDAIIECHHLTGDDCFILKIAVASIAELEDVIARFRRFGTTTTSVVLSSPVEGKPARPQVTSST